MLSLGFWEPVLILAGLNAIIAIGVYITLMSGQASLAHAAFAGIGGYTAAVLTTNFHVPFPLAILAGASVGLVVGALLSLVTMRMSLLVVALTTLGFGETMVVIAFNIEYLGGAQSFSGIPLYTSIGLVYAVLALVLFVTWRFDHSRLGLAARAVRDSSVTAAAMGINVPLVRILTFALGGGIAALGGGLSAHYTLVINPGDMSFFESFRYKLFVLTGGSYTFLGPLAGALALTLLPEALRVALALSDVLSQSLRFMIYGIIVVLVVIWRPQGVITRVPTGVRARFPWPGRPAARVSPAAKVATLAAESRAERADASLGRPGADRP